MIEVPRFLLLRTCTFVQRRLSSIFFVIIRFISTKPCFFFSVENYRDLAGGI